MLEPHNIFLLVRSFGDMPPPVSEEFATILGWTYHQIPAGSILGEVNITDFMTFFFLNHAKIWLLEFTLLFVGKKSCPRVPKGWLKAFPFCMYSHSLFVQVNPEIGSIGIMWVVHK